MIDTYLTIFWALCTKLQTLFVHFVEKRLHSQGRGKIGIYRFWAALFRPYCIKKFGNTTVFPNFYYFVWTKNCWLKTAQHLKSWMFFARQGKSSKEYFRISRWFNAVLRKTGSFKAANPYLAPPKGHSVFYSDFKLRIEIISVIW